MRFFLCGLGLGLLAGYSLELQNKIKMREHLIDEINVRSDLLNWIISDGIYMQPTDFIEQYLVRAKFINIVTVYERGQ